MDENEEVEELIHALVSNPDHVIPIGDYQMLMMLYPVLNQALTSLHFMKTELHRLRTDDEQHTDYLIQLSTEYEGFDGELIDPAILKLTNILIPANIIIGLLSQHDYEIPWVDRHVLETIRDLIKSIQYTIRTASPQDRQGVIYEYYGLIPGFNPAEIPNALTKIDRAIFPEDSQPSMGGKRNKRTNKRRNKKKSKRK
jgi:hypothetical protein